MNELHLFAGAGLTPVSKCGILITGANNKEEAMSIKRCSKCQEEKTLNDFYPAKKGRVKTWCKDCEKEYQRNLYKDNPERCRKRARDWREKYADKHNERRRQNRIETYITESARKYDISKERARELANTTHCECCGIEFATKELPLARRNIDHCHVTGAVRGAICSRCNTVLGLVKDSGETLSYLTEYVEERCTITLEKSNA